MAGHLAPAGDSEERVPIEGPVSIYRDPERDEEIVASSEGEETPLGIYDISASRMKDGSAPVVVEPPSDGVEIRNEGSTSDVVVRVGNEERSLDEGSETRVSNHAAVDIGYSATLEVVPE